MTVLLVLVTFAAFVLLDYVVTRGRARAPAPARPLPQPAARAPEPVWVAGFQLPEGLHYHRGHTWARVDDDGAVVVGLDDFARRLVSPATAVRLPAVGEWLRQGEPAFGVEADGRGASLVAPLEGEVLAVNADVAARPGLASDDPYGRGWLVKLRPSGLATGLRNLFSGSLARRFMEDAREALDLRLMALSGSVLHDGGEPATDFARHLGEADWRRLVRDFLLT
jgi:glycine cleavage system H protein